MQLIPAKYLENDPTWCDKAGDCHMGKISSQSLEDYKENGHTLIFMQSRLLDYIMFDG